MFNVSLSSLRTAQDVIRLVIRPLAWAREFSFMPSFIRSSPLSIPLSISRALCVGALALTTACESTPRASDASVDPARAAVAASENPPAAASAPATDGRTALIWVNGMGCPLCANNVDSQLKKVPGVEDVKINLGTGIVNVRLSSSGPSTQAQLEQAIDRTGFTLVRIQMPTDSKSAGGGA